MSESTQTASELLILPGEGEQSGTHLKIKIRSGQQGGHYSIMEGEIAPHQLLSPHSHEHEDQAVIVLSGELEFEVGGDGGERFTAPAGSYVIKPKGSQHCFWNTKDEPARYVELSTEDGFENFMDSTTSEGTEKAIAKSGRDYDMTWYFERVPKLMLEHKLTSLAGASDPWEKINVGSPEEIVAKLRESIRGIG